MDASPSSPAQLGGAAVDDEAIVRRCAAISARSRLTGITVDDAMQVGRLALWQAREEGRVPADPDHAVRYLYRRAFGAIVDLHRESRRWVGQGRVPGQAPRLVLKDAPPDSSIDRSADPQATFAVCQAVAHFARRAMRQQRECIAHLVAGRNDVETAQAMGVTPSRISQIKRAARALLAQWL